MIKNIINFIRLLKIQNIIIILNILLLLFFLPNLAMGNEQNQEIKFITKSIKTPGFEQPVSVYMTGSKDTNVIVLVHGLGYKAHNDWLPVIPSLVEDYQIVTFDLPGFGKSISSSEELSPKTYSQMIKHIILQVVQKPVIIIGHSMGAAISLYFSSENPDLVERLIMVNSAGIIHKFFFPFSNVRE